jgi:catechol 2,3-dioxygenase-like lactoylglutathione lyase family enzyme
MSTQTPVCDLLGWRRDRTRCLRLAYTRLVVINHGQPTQPEGVPWLCRRPVAVPGISERTVQHDLDIEESTGPHNSMVPHTFVLKTRPVEVQMAELPPPAEGIVLAHFIVSDDVERSRRFYTEVLGGRVIFTGPGGLTYVALSNSWIIINVGGGPTDDKPAVTLETPRDPDRVSSFLNIRVKDIKAVYAEWSARGADFLTPPKQHEYEIRCYIRDPDGHLIEVGQTTDPNGDWVPGHWPSGTEESE